MEGKVSSGFKEAIKRHLDEKANACELFCTKYNNPEKNIDDCVKYIIGQVQKSGVCGFDDAEIYSMAVHYYEETDIKVEDIPDCQVVINHRVELTPEEIAEAKQKAKDEVFNSERNRLTSRPSTKKQEPKKEVEEPEQWLLFDET